MLRHLAVDSCVYPAIWEDEYALDFLMDHYMLLVEFYRDAANKGNAIACILALTQYIALKSRSFETCF
jgi:hypothetical protein